MTQIFYLVSVHSFYWENFTKITLVLVKTLEEIMKGMLTLVLVLTVYITGCAFGGFSRGNIHDVSPTFSEGTTKQVIVEQLGPPDKYVNLGDSEYMTYRTTKGFFVLLFGQTKARDFEIKLVDGKYQSSRWLPSGSSIGILSAQGAVAE